MIQSVIQDILIAVTIIAIVAAGFIYAPDPLGKSIARQIHIIRK